MDHLSWQYNFLMLYTEYRNKVEGYYRFILDLGQWAETRASRSPLPSFVEEITQSKIEGTRPCTTKAQLQYLTCQTQVKERPQSELELSSRMTDKLVNLFNYISMMHECAVEFLTNIEKIVQNLSYRCQHHLLSRGYQHHPTKIVQGFPNRSQHHSPQMIKKITPQVSA